LRLWGWTGAGSGTASGGAPPTGASAAPGGRFLLGAGVLGAGEFVAQLSVFLRNVIVVRTLTKTDYGIAATFALTIAIISSASQLSADVMMVQAKEGSDPTFQRVAQLLRFAQGVVRALAIFLLAPVMCALFNTPEACWIYQLLAVIPLLEGLGHLDPKRYTREMRYLPHVLVTTMPELASLLVVCAAVPFVQDYRLVVLALIGGTLATLVTSHLTATRAYRWSTHGPYVRMNFSFAWPLFLNSLLMLLVSQGDRFLIGSAETLSQLLQGWSSWFGPLPEPEQIYDKAALAVYSIAVSLTFLPQTLAAKTIPALFLPILSSLQGNRAAFARSYQTCLGLMSLLATLLATGFLFCGTEVTVLIYSDRYAGVAPFIGWLGIASAIRVLRMGPTVAAYAEGDTKILLYANLGRSVLVLGYLFIALSGLPLVWMSRCLVLGEVLATALSVLLLWTRHGVRPDGGLRAAVFLIAWVGIGLASDGFAGAIRGESRILLTVFAEMLVVASAVAFVVPVAQLREMLAARGRDESAIQAEG